MQDYHQLEIWQRAMTYAADVHRFALPLPDIERYNLAAQLRKAATSVPLNIAEGAARASNPEFARVPGYAYPSLKEVGTCLELCRRLYPELPSETIDVLLDESNQVSRMTNTLMQRLNTAVNAI